MQFPIPLRSQMLACASWSMCFVFQVQTAQPSLRVHLTQMDVKETFQVFHHYVLVQLYWIDCDWTCWHSSLRLPANINPLGSLKIMSPTMRQWANVTLLDHDTVTMIRMTQALLALLLLTLMKHHDPTIRTVHSTRYMQMMMSMTALTECAMLKPVKMIHWNLICVHCRMVATAMTRPMLEMHAV